MYYRSIVLSFFLFTLWVTVLGALFYLTTGLSAPALVLIGLLSLCGLLFFMRYSPHLVPSWPSSGQINAASTLLNIVLTAGCTLLIYYLARHAGDAALRTPWTAVGPKFYYGLFVALFLTVYLAAHKKLHPLALSAVLFVAFGIALLLFAHGFGFDGHVHQATEKIIATEGSIEPKRLYYSGQYALVSFFQALLNSGKESLIPLLDRFLVPVLAALFLPLIAWRRFRHPAAALALLFTPLVSLFILTTPQALSYLFFLILALLLFTGKPPLWTDYVLYALIALGIFLIHPLTGIPAFGLLALWVVNTFNLKKENRRTFVIAVSVIIIFALPIAFLFNEYKAAGSFPDLAALAQRISTLTLPQLNLSRFLHNYFSFTLNAVYGIQLILWPLFVAISYAGWRRCGVRLPHALFAMLMVASAALLFIFNRHPMVIEYEQFNYAGRLLVLSALSILPFFIFMFVRALEAIQNKSAISRVCTYAGCALFTLTLIYLSYPRVDRAVSTHAYATRSADIETVQTIQRHAGTEPYAVLANQQVSAAALDVFGFAAPGVQTYFKTQEGQTYFYPIPTGGQLYSYYLSLVNDGPRLNTIQAVLEFTGADLLYFVVNDYWWQSSDISASAERIAHETISIQNGKNTIFVFYK